MPVGRNTEPQVNGRIAEVLRKQHPLWNEDTLFAERTGVLTNRSKQPDIVLQLPNQQPVIIETAFLPASTVEEDAKARLRQTISSRGKAVETSIAVKIPSEIREGPLNKIEGANFDYATFSVVSDNDVRRFPERGWLRGGVVELADAMEALSLSERTINASTELLERYIDQAAFNLNFELLAHAKEQLAELLHQEAGTQTLRMASAIIFSALVFHASIDRQIGIPPFPSDPNSPLEKIPTTHTILAAWAEILEVDYWPIFSIASKILQAIPVLSGGSLIQKMVPEVLQLVNLGIGTYHDLCGRVFQRLISDRKFLATFYTLPASSTLLAELAMDKLRVDWGDRKAIADLEIADFACGTGALLKSVQQSILRRYRRTGNDDSNLHPCLMESVLIGLDIMPAAAHLTCSMLSSTHPSIPFRKSRIHTMAYGGEADQIGSLDLLSVNLLHSLFEGESQTMGAKEIRDSRVVSIENESLDMVIMNPPFTRPTNHESTHAEVPVPSFAGFSTSKEEQRGMSLKLRKSFRLMGNGNAGIASNFIDLAHLKLKEGGVLALVLPITAIQGKSWAKVREVLTEQYSDIEVVSIASSGQTDRAFSADTSLAECLIVARKRKADLRKITFSNIAGKPKTNLEALIYSKNLPTSVQTDKFEGNVAGITSLPLIEFSRGFLEGRLQLPRANLTKNLPVTTLDTLGKRGLVHRDIVGGPSDYVGDGPTRGPFQKTDLKQYQSSPPVYPMLWSHNSEIQRRIIVPIDSEGIPRPDDEERAQTVWNNTKSRLHSNLSFRLNSQSLAMCYTSAESIGGSAWPNVRVTSQEHEIALLLWANSTIGLIMYWWHGTRQRAGRTVLTITTLPSLPFFDIRTLSGDQIHQIQHLFDEIKDAEFLPANEAYRDSARQNLDRRLYFDVLEWDEQLSESLDLLRLLWCSEPSVHGGKSTRPSNHPQ